MCGKFVEVDDTDAEGRLVLAGEYHFNCFLSEILKVALRRVALCFDRAEVAYSIDVATLIGYVALLNHLISVYVLLLDRAMYIALGEISRVPSVTMAADDRNIVKQMVDLPYPLEPT